MIAINTGRDCRSCPKTALRLRSVLSGVDLTTKKSSYLTAETLDGDRLVVSAREKKPQPAPDNSAPAKINDREMGKGSRSIKS